MLKAIKWLAGEVVFVAGWFLASYVFIIVHCNISAALEGALPLGSRGHEVQILSPRPKYK